MMIGLLELGSATRRMFEGGDGQQMQWADHKPRFSAGSPCTPPKRLPSAAAVDPRIWKTCITCSHGFPQAHKSQTRFLRFDLWVVDARSSESPAAFVDFVYLGNRR